MSLQEKLVRGQTNVWWVLQRFKFSKLVWNVTGRPKHLKEICLVLFISHWDKGFFSPLLLQRRPCYVQHAPFSQIVSVGEKQNLTLLSWEQKSIRWQVAKVHKAKTSLKKIDKWNGQPSKVVCGRQPTLDQMDENVGFQVAMLLRAVKMLKMNLFLIKVWNVVKVNSDEHCTRQFLPWWKRVEDDVLLNDDIHALIGLSGFKVNLHMICPNGSSDLNPTQNLWSIIRWC